MKFTTLIPTTRNDGTPFKAEFLERVIEQLWRPFKGISEEGIVKGRWMSESGVIYRDINRKISLECSRERLLEVIRAVKKVGRRLEQEAMHIEISGYDGEQILYIR